MSEIREKIVHFGSRRSALVRSRCTYVAVWPAWIGFGGLWAPDSEDSGSAAFAQRVHPAEQFRAERGEAEHVDTVRSGQCTPRAAMWLKNAASPLNPPPKSMLKGSKFFFRTSARSSNTHQRGLIWSAMLTPVNFREKTCLQS